MLDDCPFNCNQFWCTLLCACNDWLRVVATVWMEGNNKANLINLVKSSGAEQVQSHTSTRSNLQSNLRSNLRSNPVDFELPCFVFRMGWFIIELWTCVGIANQSYRCRDVLTHISSQNFKGIIMCNTKWRVKCNFKMWYDWLLVVNAGCFV